MNLMHFFPTLVHSVLCNSENGGLNNSDSSSCSMTFMNSSSDKFSKELAIKLETGISIGHAPFLLPECWCQMIVFFLDSKDMKSDEIFYIDHTKHHSNESSHGVITSSGLTRKLEFY